MQAILGIDAAWTPDNPSGVALLRRLQPELDWQCIALAPSYEAFICLAEEDGADWAEPNRWQGPVRGGAPEPDRLLEAAQQLLDDEPVSVVSVDMPMAHVRIMGRRECDNAVSRQFGAMGCSTHSPTPERPGEISVQMTAGLKALDYQLEVGIPHEGEVATPHEDTVIEVYPHPALLTLLHRGFRVPYKVSKSSKYWPKMPKQMRAEHLFEEFQAIYAGLAGALNGLPLEFLPAPPYPSLNFLKRYEDALDALVCAWVGSRYLDGQANHYGDDQAAIWIP